MTGFCKKYRLKKSINALAPFVRCALGGCDGKEKGHGASKTAEHSVYHVTAWATGFTRKAKRASEMEEGITESSSLSTAGKCL